MPPGGYRHPPAQVSLARQAVYILLFHHLLTELYALSLQVWYLRDVYVFYGATESGGRAALRRRGPSPESFNPSDYFLDLLSPDSRTAETEAATRFAFVSLPSVTFVPFCCNVI